MSQSIAYNNAHLKFVGAWSENGFGGEAAQLAGYLGDQFEFRTNDPNPQHRCRLINTDVVSVYVDGTLEKTITHADTGDVFANVNCFTAGKTGYHNVILRYTTTGSAWWASDANCIILADASTLTDPDNYATMLFWLSGTLATNSAVRGGWKDSTFTTYHTVSNNWSGNVAHTAHVRWQTNATLSRHWMYLAGQDMILITDGVAGASFTVPNAAYTMGFVDIPLAIDGNNHEYVLIAKTATSFFLYGMMLVGGTLTTHSYTDLPIYVMDGDSIFAGSTGISDVPHSIAWLLAEQASWDVWNFSVAGTLMAVAGQDITHVGYPASVSKTLTGYIDNWGTNDLNSGSYTAGQFQTNCTNRYAAVKSAYPSALGYAIGLTNRYAPNFIDVAPFTAAKSAGAAAASNSNLTFFDPAGVITSPMTSDGLHLNDTGAAAYVSWLAGQLGISPSSTPGGMIMML